MLYIANSLYCNNVLLPTLFVCVNNIVKSESGVTKLNNNVDNIEHCVQQNIVQSCFYQHCNKWFIFCCVDGRIRGG